MRQVNATEFRARFGEFADALRKEPIEVLQGNKPIGVFLSSEEYEHLQRLDDAYWIARAKAAEAEGQWVGHGEAVRLLTEQLTSGA